ncbi:hypothetical protein MOO44_03915 [Nicoliella spurrieriana]|uniref:Uncharacterized protein n=1 Tax=Nicoliella spurrieriana TaxID=2925830 RepID=A0A976X5U0_9LACO|nr:hypothetical protein [Nicoliella spurrieriana]UQS87313.1 hypothetical protein MOO44_03915 [Nicoliella spurrieriana]
MINAENVENIQVNPNDAVEETEAVVTEEVNQFIKPIVDWGNKLAESDFESNFFYLYF